MIYQNFKIRVSPFFYFSIHLLMLFGKKYTLAERKAEAKGMTKGMAKGRAKGLAEGLAEGEALGEAKGITSTARRMLSMSFTSEQISQATGLSPDEVEALRSGTGN